MIFLTQVKRVVGERWYLIIAEDDVSALKKIKDFWATEEVISIACLAKPADLPGGETNSSIHKLEYNVMRSFVEQYSRYMKWVDEQSSIVRKPHKRRSKTIKKRKHRR